MSINLSITVQSPADAPHAKIEPRQLAAFRHFARDHDQLPEYDDPANNDPLPYAFDARVCLWAMASICALFGHDTVVIAVVEEAQFRGRNVRFWKDDLANDLRMCIANTFDGSPEMNLANPNAYAVLDALGLEPNDCGSIAVDDLAARVNDPATRERLSDQGIGRYLDQLDRFAGYRSDTEEVRLIWA